MKKRLSLLRVYDKSLIIEPIEALSKLGKEKLKGKSIETLKKEARK